MSIKRWKLGWKRCDCVKCEAALTIEQTEEDCGWVRWGDHKEENARLKAEVERVEPELEQRCRELNLSLAHQAVQLKQIGELKAEIERLRKAGDKLAGGRTHTFTIHGLLIPDPDVVAWNAAKEGKPSV